MVLLAKLTALRGIGRIVGGLQWISKVKPIICGFRKSVSLYSTPTRVIDTDIYGTSPSAAGFHNYDAERKTFYLEKPEYFNFASHVIDKWAKTDHERGGLPAFWWVGDDGSETKWTFSDLASGSRRAANVLSGPCAMKRGDVVIIIMGKHPAWWLINIASIRAGIVLSPGTTQLTAKDIRLRLEASGARAIIADADIAERIEQVDHECPGLMQTKLLIGAKRDRRMGWLSFDELYNQAKPDFHDVKTKSDDPMTIFFTSGTTGSPKMCLHSHASYGLGHYISGKYWMDLTPHDVHWSLSDTGWAKAAWSNLFAPWILGACVFITQTPRFDPCYTLKVLEKYPISTFCAPPTAYRYMIQEDLNKYKFQNIRHCMSAGEPLNPEVTEKWFNGTHFTIREGYGQSETVLQSAVYRCIPNKPGSMGKPPPGMDVRIVDDDGGEVPDDVEGNIGVCVKPHTPIGFFHSYVGDPMKTASTMRGDFYLTGDRAYRDEDGYLWFVGRSDDVINSAGYRIGPFEVESALIEHAAVAESAVVSSPDSQRGEVVKAFIVLTDPHKHNDDEALKKDIQDHVKSTTAPYKYPRKIEFVETLPKTVSGKIRRVELRNKEWNRTEN